jgi:hypothetical protein
MGTAKLPARLIGMQENRPQSPKVYRAEDVRQGEIILRRPWQRWLFAIGLFGGIILMVLLAIFVGTQP